MNFNEIVTPKWGGPTRHNSLASAFAHKPEGQTELKGESDDRHSLRRDARLPGARIDSLIFPSPLPVSAVCQDLPPGKTNHKAE